MKTVILWGNVAKQLVVLAIVGALVALGGMVFPALGEVAWLVSALCGVAVSASMREGWPVYKLVSGKEV